MNKRLLDHLMLVEIRNAGRSLVLSSDLKKGVSYDIDVNCVRTHKYIGPSEEIAHAEVRLEMALEYRLRESGAEENAVTASVRLHARFNSVPGATVSTEDVDEQAHALARLIFPAARLELLRLCAGSKIPDVHVPWDLGPAEPPDSAVEH